MITGSKRVVSAGSLRWNFSRAMTSISRDSHVNRERAECLSSSVQHHHHHQPTVLGQYLCSVMRYLDLSCAGTDLISYD